MYVIYFSTPVVQKRGAGFFLACEDLGECSTIHSPPALFFFFFEVEINCRTLIPFFMPGSVHSGSAS